MSSPSRPSGATIRRFAFAAALVAAAASASSCTVRPLYADAGLETGSLAGNPAGLSHSVTVKPVETRVGLEVRNHLIFLLYGGRGQPVTADYSVDVGVTTSSTRVAVVQVTRDSEPTSAIVTAASLYKIVDNKTGKPVAAGKRAVSASYDIPRQEFAALRAERDAENRAARELAEILRHTIAQDLERLPAS